MSIQKLVNEIIPPSDYQHRNGFSNTHLIDPLNEFEKQQVEDALIYKLLCETDKNTDTLIVETLAYLKSKKSLPILKDLLTKCSYDLSKLIIATSIFEINGDDEMANIAAASFKNLDNEKDSYYIYKLIEAFYQLIKFKNDKLNKIIEGYTMHREYLVAYNAKRALER